jgi:toxin YoeB
VRVVWAKRAKAEYREWQRTKPEVALRIIDLIDAIEHNPFRGLGKPEPLKNNWAGWWSRRITGEHRLVYRVVGKGEAQVLEIAQCRFHY